MIAAAALAEAQALKGARYDGFSHLAQSFGTTEDATMDVGFDPTHESYNHQELQHLWRGGGILRSYVEIPARDIFGPHEITTGSLELDEYVRWRMVKTKLFGRMLDAEYRRRSQGGGAVYKKYDDGRDPAYPVAPGAKLVFTRALDPVELRATGGQWDHDPQSETFLEPWMWTVMWMTGGAQNIHPSRLVLMPGPTVSNWDRLQHEGWGLSGLATVVRKAADLDLGHRSHLNMLAQASVGVLGVHDLGTLVSKEDAQDAISRMRIWRRVMSTANIALIDSKLESFTRVNAPLTGVDASILTLMRITSAWLRIPMSRLFGETPSGLNSTGDADEANYYKECAGEQETRVGPQLAAEAKLICQEIDPNYSGEPEVHWDALYEPTDKEQAETALATAQADKIYVDMMPSLAVPIARARFTGAKCKTKLPVAVFDQADRDAAAKRARPAAQLTLPGLTSAGQQGASPALPDDHPLASTALNGAQVTAALEIAEKVQSGNLQRAAALEMLQTFFQLSLEEAQGVLGPPRRRLGSGAA